MIWNTALMYIDRQAIASLFSLLWRLSEAHNGKQPSEPTLRRDQELRTEFAKLVNGPPTVQLCINYRKTDRKTDQSCDRFCGLS